MNPPDAASGQTLTNYFAAAAKVPSAGNPSMVQGGVIMQNNMTMGGGTTPMSTPMATPGGGGGSSGSGGAGGSGGQSTGAAPVVGDPKGVVVGAMMALVGWLL